MHPEVRYNSVCTNIIDNNQKLKTTQMPKSIKMDKFKWGILLREGFPPNVSCFSEHGGQPSLPVKLIFSSFKVPYYFFQQQFSRYLALSERNYSYRRVMSMLQAILFP